MEPRYRVLHVANSLGLGGTEKAMQLMASHLDRERFEPYVHSPLDGPRRALLRAAGVPVFAGGDLLAVLERLKPHVVHLHRAGWPEPGPLSAVKRFGPRAVVETNVFGRFDPTPLARTIHLHLHISRFCLERVLAHHPGQADPARLRVLHYPVDTDRLGELAPERDFSLPTAARLARPDPGKWSALICPALTALKSLVPDFRFLVVGAVPGFEDFVRDQGLADNVELCPPVLDDAEIAAFLGRATQLAHANDTGESFGLAIAEAMASGLPVVTHPAEGQRDNAQLELVDHGVTGLVAATAEDYAQAQAWLWRNPERARAMGLAGREKARRFFRAQEIGRQLGAIYLELLEGA
ncbi:GDP-mannose-dependent alpha-(1-6)-phosphatidylinositol monomannoside mannosyltransferase [Fundidesulfovibrio magnetotacticus]|uniref:GDP-mannose-dependent alpha-(1-6)-phosphatidylinositol monomannoside mannosyltransferase n=1 Tax=Fundidesulfovibrio magnetotacticus TaxID=2730080 RepID=A0A6V8LSC4_9BACT|nr:glycosyltransferase family 4 protein [Fundidesulfovibrio magnetotacticus]GFK94644.1 GDP-mannose-dependent alpha-(1-6)-phosphatidylinositol monomannoside mannosyltransferase [Fundidesulfovibrio magnetotacticus]